MNRRKDQFFGRERVLREIVTGVLATQPASFSLVGAKLAGKSRLLDYLASPSGPLLSDEYAAWRPFGFQDASRVVVTLIDCQWQECEVDLLDHVADRVEHQLRVVERLQLDWDAVTSQPGPSRRLWQIGRQLTQMGYRLVLLMDNFDTVFEEQLLTPASVDELRPLTREAALVVATEQPLHDLDRELAASPLFNVMSQLFIGLLDPASTRAWLDAYAAEVPALEAIREPLVELTGSHPLLLLRVGDILDELPLLGAPGQRITAEYLPIIRLRLAEHGRLLFVTYWRNLQQPPKRIDERLLMGVIERLLRSPLATNQVAREHIPALNWLINQGMVIFGGHGYRLFSPLFAEFLANRLANVTHAMPAPRPLSVVAPPADEGVYEQLTKTERALLHYFQTHSYAVIAPEQLLAEVWKRPDASPRRVQEAIRRLRLQLDVAVPAVGSIENERGRGYRFIPAAA